MEGGSLARNSFPTRSYQKETADLEGGGKRVKNLHSESYFYNKTSSLTELTQNKYSEMVAVGHNIIVL